MHRVDFGQALDNKATNGPLFCFVHPVERHVVRVGVQGKLGAESVVAALVRCPEERVSFEIERGLEALRFIERFGKEEDDGQVDLKDCIWGSEG